MSYNLLTFPGVLATSIIIKYITMNLVQSNDILHVQFNGMQDPLIMEVDSGQYPKVASFFEKLLT